MPNGKKSNKSPSEKGTVMAGGRGRPKRRKSTTVYPMPQVGRVPGTTRWELESIMDYRLSPAIASPQTARDGAKRTVYFVIKWAGYKDDELTLEPAINLLATSESAVNAFLAGKGLKLERDEKTMETWLVDAEPKKSKGA